MRIVVILAVFLLAAAALFFCVGTGRAEVTSEGSFIITRLNSHQPIITEQMFIDLGAGSEEGVNIDGPSMIRVPDWIAPQDRADPNAQYYLYFASHTGGYIRMAWAEYVEGPWHLYRVGSGISVGTRGVLDLGSTGRIDIGNNLNVRDHVASPDIHVDDTNHRIIMYFHGNLYLGSTSKGQQTVVATSSTGLDFNGHVEPVMLGESYFSVFGYNGGLYAISNGGNIYKALDANNPWLPPTGFNFGNRLWLLRSDDPFQTDLDNDGFPTEVLRVRHVGLFMRGDVLDVFYSRRGDSPERIQLSTMDLSVGDYTSWDPAYPPEEILQAEPGWEGGEIPPAPSETASAPENVNQLRDPYIFEDTDGKLYLMYTGRGENALGLAGVDIAGDFEPDGDVDWDDVATLAGGWLNNCVAPDWCGGCDIDKSGRVDFVDFSKLAENWMQNI
jgi:hypothetical protein